MANTPIRLLHEVDNAMKKLDEVKLTVNNYIAITKLRDIYKGLRSERATSSANRIMIHVENVVRELDQLEDALKDGQLVLLKKVEYNEQEASR